MLSKQAIEEYQKIYQKEYGEEISYEEAKEQGTRLLKFFEILIEVDQKNKKLKNL